MIENWTRSPGIGSVRYRLPWPPDATVPPTPVRSPIAHAGGSGRQGGPPWTRLVIKIGITKTRQDITMHIRDDGRGFEGASFGYSDQHAVAAGVEPFSPRERVHELGGLLGVTSSAACVELRIELPLT